jgi:hypothetical protein
MKGGSNQSLEMLQVVGRVPDKQAVAGLQTRRWKLGHEERFPSPNLLHAHLVTCSFQNLPERLSGREAVLAHGQLGIK